MVRLCSMDIFVWYHATFCPEILPNLDMGPTGHRRQLTTDWTSFQSGYCQIEILT